MAALLDIIKKGSTDRSATVRVIDDSAGTPETSVAYDTGGVALWYRRQGGLKVTITPASLSALDDAHSDGGFLHIADGECRLDLPDVALATGANYVDIGGAFTGMIVIGGRVRLVDYDPENSNLGMAPGDFKADVSGLATAAALAIVDGVADSILTAIGNLNDPTAAQIATLVEAYIVNEGDATAVMQALADRIAADWVAGDASPLAIASAVRTNLTTELGRLDASVSSRSSHDAAAVKTAIEADGSKVDHLWEMTEDDLGTRRLTANALEEGAAGSGGDATEANQILILADTAAILAAGSTGDGSIVVDHDTGGTDALRYVTSGGAGIDNATVKAFLTADYDAGNWSAAFVQAQVTTSSDGRWSQAMNLDAGDYTFVFSKQGIYSLTTVEATIS